MTNIETTPFKTLSELTVEELADYRQKAKLRAVEDILGFQDPTTWLKVISEVFTSFLQEEDYQACESSNQAVFSIRLLNDFFIDLIDIENLNRGVDDRIVSFEGYERRRAECDLLAEKVRNDHWMKLAREESPECYSNK